ncbi:MAG: hypothetical protein AB1631_15195 [Acidobacteriota bacterium]
MSNGRLGQILEEVKLLPPDQQIAIRNAIDEIIGERQLSEDEALQKKLMDKGLLNEIKPPVKRLASRPARRLIECKGRPLSETIIEEWM